MKEEKIIVIAEILIPEPTCSINGKFYYTYSDIINRIKEQLIGILDQMINNEEIIQFTVHTIVQQGILSNQQLFQFIVEFLKDEKEYNSIMLRFNQFKDFCINLGYAEKISLLIERMRIF